MAVVYVLAHFDDEYCALPLIRQDLAAGRDLRFVHLVDYRTPKLAETRRRETEVLLRRLGVPDGAAVHLGANTGWLDGQFHRHAAPAYAALKNAVRVGTASFGPVERLVTTAWEGGHPDHDVCAAIAAKLARELGGVPLDQICLYQGKGLPGPFYRASAPLAENGPAREIRLGAADWLRWGAEVRAFPSQVKAWSGLLPAMAWTFMRQGAFRYQRLDPARIGERPHEGSLFYERMFRTPYAMVREAVDSLG